MAFVGVISAMIHVRLHQSGDDVLQDQARTKHVISAVRVELKLLAHRTDDLRVQAVEGFRELHDDEGSRTHAGPLDVVESDWSRPPREQSGLVTFEWVGQVLIDELDAIHREAQPLALDVHLDFVRR